MGYDPDKHHRRSIRLPAYDYAGQGAYFITICACAHERSCLFGKTVDGVMHLNDKGQIALSCWQAIPQHYSFVRCQHVVVMPNHMHGILEITEENTGVVKSPAFGQPVASSIGMIVGKYKAAVTRSLNRLPNASGETIWQRNYHEHIIRNQSSYDEFVQYIYVNPERWQNDTFFME